MFEIAERYVYRRLKVNRNLMIVALLALVLLGSGCASMQSSSSTIQTMTWNSLEEAMDNYRLVTAGKTTVNELVNERGFDPDRVSMSLREENPTKIRNDIMGTNPNIRYEDLSASERQCFDANKKEEARTFIFPLRVTTETSEGNVFLEKLKIKKEKREKGKTLNAYFCYNHMTGIVLYKTVSYGNINNLRVDRDPVPDALYLLPFKLF